MTSDPSPTGNIGIEVLVERLSNLSRETHLWMSRLEDQRSKDHEENRRALEHLEVMVQGESRSIRNELGGKLNTMNGHVEELMDWRNKHELAIASAGGLAVIGELRKKVEKLSSLNLITETKSSFLKSQWTWLTSAAAFGATVTALVMRFLEL